MVYHVYTTLHMSICNCLLNELARDLVVSISGYLKVVGLYVKSLVSILKSSNLSFAAKLFIYTTIACN